MRRSPPSARRTAPAESSAWKARRRVIDVHEAAGSLHYRRVGLPSRGTSDWRDPSRAASNSFFSLPICRASSRSVCNACGRMRRFPPACHCFPVVHDADAVATPGMGTGDQGRHRQTARQTPAQPLAHGDPPPPVATSDAKGRQQGRLRATRACPASDMHGLHGVVHWRGSRERHRATGPHPPKLTVRLWKLNIRLNKLWDDILASENGCQKIGSNMHMRNASNPERWHQETSSSAACSLPRIHALAMGFLSEDVGLSGRCVRATQHRTSRPGNPPFETPCATF